MTISAGTRLGPYEIVSPLGAGGMGLVYRARDTRLGREVAVKVLPAHRAHDSDALARLEREAQAVAALSHPNILAIQDLGTDQGVFFVVTELLEGETLRNRLERPPHCLAWVADSYYTSSMKTLTVRLPEEIVADIEEESRGRRVSKSDVVRERLRLPARPSRSRRKPADTLADLVGSVDGLPADLSERKKTYLKATGYGRKRTR
jgi:Arc/MetJ-type ribon-helix-helix transcriptional regulator